MTTTTAVLFACVLIASLFAGVWAFASDRANQHLRDELDRKDDVNFHLREEIESVKDDRRMCQKELNELNSLLALGTNILSTYEIMSGNSPRGTIAVVAWNVLRTKMFVIKEFYYEANDAEDRDFAIREANELIEILKS